MSFSQDQIAKHIVVAKKWNPQQSKPEDSFSYIDLSAVDKEKKIINLSEVPEILCIDAPSRAKQLVKASDILVSTVRPNLNGVAIVPKSLDEATASTGYCVLRANNTTLNPNYLFYWVQTPAFIADMMSKATGANYPAVSDKTIKESKIPLPPLAEQQKIAEILDAADALRQKDQQLITHYEQLGQSLFLEMFGDPVVNPKGWDIVKIESICHKITDGTHQSPTFLSEGIPFLFVSNIINNQISYKTKKFISRNEYEILTKNTPIEVGDILYTSVGSYGNPAIVELEQEFCFQRHIAHIKPNHSKINVKYFKSLLQSNYIKNQADRLARGVAQKTLNLKAIKSFDASLPPIHLQNQFADRITAIETQKQQAQQNLEQSEKLFNSLLQRAFKGELTA